MSDLILPKHLQLKEPVTARVKLKITVVWRDPPLSRAEEAKRSAIQKGMDAEASKMEETIRQMVEGTLQSKVS